MVRPDHKKKKKLIGHQIKFDSCPHEIRMEWVDHKKSQIQVHLY